MSKMHRLTLVAALLAFIALSMTGAAIAAGFNQFIVFGDSTLDTGYFAYLPNSGDATFDTGMQTALGKGLSGGWAGNGTMNTIMLAQRFGLDLIPSDAPGGGTNFANAGATTVVNPQSMVPANICTLYQIDNYLASRGGAANPHALYLIKSGDNDVTYYYFTANQTFRNENPTYLQQGAIALSERVANLQAAGAQTIVVRNSYDSALFAQAGGDINPLFREVMRSSRQLGREEWAYMAQRGVRFVPVDNDYLFGYIAHHPADFGFTTQSVLSANAPFYNIHAAWDVLTDYQQSHFLFIDGVHLTTAGQMIEADLTYSMLTAPSTVSLLAESVVQGGWTRAATIQGQIEASGMQRGACGRNYWATVGDYNTQIRNAPGFANDSGSPFGGSVGMDYQLENGLILGMALTFGSQSQGFSTGGHFDQVDEAPSLYAAYTNGPLWGNAVLTYNLFQDVVDRNVPLGAQFTDFNHGYTSGQSLALALRGGRDFKRNRITTGPVMGLIMQQAFVNGFRETSNTGITALAFEGQTRNSLVSQCGWRVLLDCDKFQPFVETNWNHEWADKDRSVTASLTTSEAPPYSMAAVPIGSDWATLSLGTYYRISQRSLLRASSSGMFANSQMENYGGEMGLNVSY